MVDLIEPSEILVDPIELTELCPVERLKVDLNDSSLIAYKWCKLKFERILIENSRFAFSLQACASN